MKVKLFKEFMSGNQKSSFLNIPFQEVAKELENHFSFELGSSEITYDQIADFESHLEMHPNIKIDSFEDYFKIWKDYQVNFQGNEDYGDPTGDSLLGEVNL